MTVTPRPCTPADLVPTSGQFAPLLLEASPLTPRLQEVPEEALLKAAEKGSLAPLSSWRGSTFVNLEATDKVNAAPLAL